MWHQVICSVTELCDLYRVKLLNNEIGIKHKYHESVLLKKITGLQGKAFIYNHVNTSNLTL